MAILGVLLPLCLLACSGRANPINPDTEALVGDPQKMDYRLPGNTAPTEYKITINTDLKNFVFEGDSVINIEVLKKSRDITLHARDLDIDPKSIKLTLIAKPNPIDVKLTAEKFELIPEKEFLIIKTESDLSVGSYELRLSYTGKITDSRRGFYRSKYVNEKKEVRWLAVTQFEPTSARYAFPCYDEPALKAFFQIIIKHDDEYTAVSNTLVDTSVSQPVVNKIRTTTFKKTPKMSTYLVAYAVTDYLVNGNGKFSVLTKPSSIDDTEYAHDFGKEELKALGKQIGIDYYGDIMKMENMAQISVPDFAAGAMENWGLVTYRESALLYNKKLSTAASKQSTGTVIAHEFAHQWFGNLVSPAWWKYIWLNEGFATYFQYAGGDKVEDKWRLMEQFVVTALQQTAFGIDSSVNARPLNSDVESPQEIAALFDGISYQKGGSVIRMMEHILTQEIFHDGLLKYLNKNKNGVATSKELFESLQLAVNEAAKAKPAKKDKKDKDDEEDEKDKVLDVAQVMDNWVNKAGYPIVNVKRDKKSVIISQEQFPIPESKEHNKWYVPINYVIGKDEDLDFEDTKPVAFLEPKEDAELEVKVPEDTWIIVNKQQTGYYRVNYDSKNWELITKQLKGENFTDIHVLNRAQLIDDAFNLARIGKLDYTIALELVSYLKEETDYIAWVPAFRGFDHLQKMLAASKQYPKFKTFVQNQLKAVVKELSFAPNETDSHIDTLARVQVLKWACAVGHKDCVKHVNGKLDAYLKDPAKAELDVNLKSHILCAAVREAKEEKWNKVFEAYKKSKDQSEKTVLLSSLGCSESPKILKSFAEKIFNDSLGVEDPDTAFSAILSGSVNGVDVGLEALENNIDIIREMDNGDAKLKKYIEALGSRITTVTQQTKLGLLVAMEGIPKEASATAIQTTFNNIFWVQSYEEKLDKWFKEHVKEQEEKKEPGSANSATFASVLIMLPILITRFY